MLLLDMGSNRTVTPVQKNFLIHRLMGTQDGEYEALIDCPGGDYLDESDVMEAIEDQIARCEECDMWCEINELIDDEGNAISCNGCGGYQIA